MKKIIIASLVLALGSAGCGPIYNPHRSPRVQVVGEGLGGIAFVREGQKYPAGAFGSGLVRAVDGNPRAVAEARAYRSASIGGFVLGMVGLAQTLGGGGVMVAAADGRDSTGLLIGVSIMINGVFVALAGSLWSASGAHHVWDAINIYNDDLPATAAPGASH